MNKSDKFHLEDEEEKEDKVENIFGRRLMRENGRPRACTRPIHWLVKESKTLFRPLLRC